MVIPKPRMIRVISIQIRTSRIMLVISKVKLVVVLKTTTSIITLTTKIQLTLQPIAKHLINLAKMPTDLCRVKTLLRLTAIVVLEGTITITLLMFRVVVVLSDLHLLIPAGARIEQVQSKSGFHSFLLSHHSASLL